MADIETVAELGDHPYDWASRPVPFRKGPRSKTLHYVNSGCPATLNTNLTVTYLPVSTLTEDQICKKCVRDRASTDLAAYGVKMQFGGVGIRIRQLFADIDNLVEVDIDSCSRNTFRAAARTLDTIAEITEIIANTGDDHEGLGEHLKVAGRHLSAKFVGRDITLHEQVVACVELVDIDELAFLLTPTVSNLKTAGMDGFIVRDAVAAADHTDLVGSVADNLKHHLTGRTDEHLPFRRKVAECVPLSLYGDFIDVNDDRTVVEQLRGHHDEIAERVSVQAAERIVAGLETLVSELVDSPPAVSVVDTVHQNAAVTHRLFHQLNPAGVQMTMLDERNSSGGAYALVGPRRLLERNIVDNTSGVVRFGFKPERSAVIDTEHGVELVGVLGALSHIEDFDVWVDTATALVNGD